MAVYTVVSDEWSRIREDLIKELGKPIRELSDGAEWIVHCTKFAEVDRLLYLQKVPICVTIMD